MGATIPAGWITLKIIHAETSLIFARLKKKRFKSGWIKFNYDSVDGVKAPVHPFWWFTVYVKKFIVQIAL